jgi:hypothetical protein
MNCLNNNKGMIMNKNNFICFFILISIFIAYSCKDNSNNSNDCNFSGITVTDTLGNIISVDPDDWKPNELFDSIIVYPNPATIFYNGTLPEARINFKFNLKEKGQVDLFFSPCKEASFSSELFKINLGKSEIKLHLSLQRSNMKGIFRVYLMGSEGKGKNYSSYGDIIFK